MKYFLTATNEDKKFQIITDVSDVLGFDYDCTKLENIVQFTHLFENEEEMRNTLIKNNILMPEFEEGRFNIILKNSDNAKVLPYGISFQEDNVFYDIDFLTRYIIKHAKDKQFLELFIARYANYLKDVPIFNEEIEEFKKSLINLKKYGRLRNGFQDKMTTFIYYFSHRKDKNGQYQPIFSKIRDLAMFAINYDRTYIRKAESSKKETSKETLRALINHYQDLLIDGDLTEEQVEVYTNYINDLQEELNQKENFGLSRRCN